MRIHWFELSQAAFDVVDVVDIEEEEEEVKVLINNNTLHNKITIKPKIDISNIPTHSVLWQDVDGLAFK